MFNSVNTCWTLVAAFLVYFMQAGFALCEAGFTRAKNTGNILMKNMMDFCIGTPCYWLIGFGIMFGGTGALIGGFDPFIQGDYSHLGLDIPLWVYIVFQTVFCATAATIVSGSLAEQESALAARQALRLQYDGTLDLRNALGRTGTVYLTVPPGRSSPGKVTLTVQEQLTEFEALTDSPAPIPTGSPVRVTGLAGRGALLVEPIPSESKETE